MAKLSVTAPLLMGLGLAGCDTKPTNPELMTGPNFAAVPNPQFTPFNLSVPNCLETVDITGTFRSVSQIFESENGNLILEFHLVAKGIGIGRITGDTYEWNDNLFSIQVQVPERHPNLRFA